MTECQRFVPAGVSEPERYSRHPISDGNPQTEIPAVRLFAGIEKCLTCRFDACRILIRAGLSPEISIPFLILLIKRMGLISAPTCSRRARIKSTISKFRQYRSLGRVSEYVSKSSQRSSSAWLLANLIAYGQRRSRVDLPLVRPRAFR
jgi:hypothetical protein